MNLSEVSLSEQLHQIAEFVCQKSLTAPHVSEIKGLQAFADDHHLTPEELILIAVVFSHQDRGRYIPRWGLKRICDPFFPTMNVYFDTLEMFTNLELIETCDGPGGECYRLHYRKYKGIRKNKSEVLSGIKPIGLERLLDYFNHRILDRGRLNEHDLETEMEYLSSLNPELNIVAQGFTVFNSSEAFLIGAVCCNKYIHNTAFDTTYMHQYFQFNNFLRNLMREVAREEFLPIKTGHMRIAGGDLLDDAPELELTDAGVEYWLRELPRETKTQLLISETKMPVHATMPRDIQPKKLLFDEAMGSSIADLERLIHPKFFQKYLESQPTSARMKGLTVLMHGAPGTGKTELALQLARKSGRALFRIDVSQIMSKWVGDSEKNLRAKLREYRHYQKNNATAPILFLNECDQLLGKRINVSQSADQMRNSMQNMLLEELETFEGILLATTNMTHNLDAAFERRFLYKLRFNNPGPDMLALHWKAALPRLNEAQCQMLATRFPFSPGEMQNIATKLRLRRLLNPKARVFDTVLELCKEEKWGEEIEKNNQKVGFIKSF